jgi:hypothetical protein
MRRLSLRIIFLSAGLCWATACSSARPDGNWREVFADSFRTWRSTIYLTESGEPFKVPSGWTIVPKPKSADKTWKWARLDGADDTRFAELSYAMTNGGWNGYDPGGEAGLPGLWLTHMLSYVSGPGFEVEFKIINYGGEPSTLAIRVVDDDGDGYESRLSLGVDDERSQILRVNPRSNLTSSEAAEPLAVSDVELAPLERGVARFVRFGWENGRLWLGCDDQTVVSAPATGRRYSAVQFLAPEGRLILDDFRMRAEVNGEPK